MCKQATTRPEPNPARRIALFLFGLFLLVATLYVVGRNYYYVDERTAVQDLIDHADQVETAVWGSSHAECIQLDKMGLLGANLSSRAQDMFEIRYKVAALSPKLPRLKTAIISMSYFSFLYDNSISIDRRKSRDAIRISMYGVYPFHLPFIRGDAGNFIFGLLSPVVTMDHWRRVFLEPPPKPKSITNTQFEKTRPVDIRTIRERVARTETRANAVSKLAYHAKRRTAGYGPLIRKMTSVHPNLAEETLDAAKETIQLLKERGVRVVLFTPPYYKDYNRRFKAKWKKSMMKTARGLSKETGASYFDFSNDPEFEDTAKLFLNSDHLNELGAALFSVKLKERMDGDGNTRRPRKSKGK